MSRLDDVDIFDNPFRDPVYEEQGFIFDPERNQYYEIIEHPVYGSIRSYLSPRDKGEAPMLSDARREADDFRSKQEIRAKFLKYQARQNAKRIDELRSKENLSGMERSLLEGLAKEMSERNRVPRGAISDEDYQKFTGINEIQSMNVGGAVNIDDENIFGTTMEMLRRENRPQGPSKSDIQESLMASTNPYGVGRTYETMVTQDANTDFTNGLRIFRSVVESIGLPPETQAEAKAIFDRDIRLAGLRYATQQLLDRFGKVSLSADKVNLGGVDPRTYEMRVATEQYLSSKDDPVSGLPSTMNLIREGDTGRGISDAEVLQRFLGASKPVEPTLKSGFKSYGELEREKQDIYDEMDSGIVPLK